MPAETSAVGLDSYSIGPKIRGLRLKKLLSLVQLGEHTGAVYNVFNIQRHLTAGPCACFAIRLC